MSRFRHMRESDLDAVLKVERGAYSHPWSEASVRNCLGNSQDSCWVLLSPEEPEEIIGHAICSVIFDEGHVLNLCIARDWQRLGFGRLLLDHIHDQLQKEGAEKIFLEVRSGNRAAYELYLSRGYRQVGVRKNYYPAAEGREDALVLQRGGLELME